MSFESVIIGTLFLAFASGYASGLIYRFLRQMGEQI